MSEKYFQQLKDEMFDDPEVREFIKSAIKEGLKDCIACPIPEDMRNNLSHINDMMRTVGEGNLDRGIERMRKNHEYIDWLRKGQTTIGGWIVKVLLVGIVGGIATIFMYGLFGKTLPWK